MIDLSSFSQKLESSQEGVSIPKFLLSDFPKTDWTKVDSSMGRALSGGPGKDGIPALVSPAFVPVDEFSHSDSVQTIVMKNSIEVKAYPYNILLWHEIVNDSADGVPIAVTFCPLCGSAIVYDRTLSDGTVATFGVSGALLESNLLMYDHDSESFWQQSTGDSLAGTYLGEKLDHVSFQLLTMGEVKQQYPDAQVLSEDTGYTRDHGANPYSGHEASDDFLFAPSSLDARYPSKTIFVAFMIDGMPVASPWLEIQEGQTYRTNVNGTAVALSKTKGELTIMDGTGLVIPFYFEMWFSWAVQHGEHKVVFDPSQANL